jgi:hypothetical protein
MWSDRIEKITDMIRQNYDHSTDCGGGDGRKKQLKRTKKNDNSLQRSLRFLSLFKCRCTQMVLLCN